MAQKRTVRVLLLEDTEDLGEVGQVVEVRPGYARNYLFPSGIGSPVTPDALRRVERAKRDAAKRRAARAKQVAELAEALEGLSLTMEQRASEEGHLFGSVGVSTIVEALAGQGLTIDEKAVQLDHPIKELGIFSVPIRLDADTSAEIRVWVVEPSSS